MERVAFESGESATDPDSLVQNRLTDALGATNVAVNHYLVPPGERLAGLHAHEEQEEVFVCLEGAVTFETLDGEYSVQAGEVIRFARSEFQSCKNDSEQNASVFAIGAPRDTDVLRVPVSCASCGHDRTEPRVRKAETVLVCPDCGHESIVECPNCGSDDVRAELAADGATPLSICQDCDAGWAAR